VDLGAFPTASKVFFFLPSRNSLNKRQWDFKISKALIIHISKASGPDPSSLQDLWSIIHLSADKYKFGAFFPEQDHLILKPSFEHIPEVEYHHLDEFLNSKELNTIRFKNEFTFGTRCYLSVSDLDSFPQIFLQKFSQLDIVTLWNSSRFLEGSVSNNSVYKKNPNSNFLKRFEYSQIEKKKTHNQFLLINTVESSVTIVNLGLFEGLFITLIGKDFICRKHFSIHDIALAKKLPVSIPSSPKNSFSDLNSFANHSIIPPQLINYNQESSLTVGAMTRVGVDLESPLLREIKQECLVKTLEKIYNEEIMKKFDIYGATLKDVINPGNQNLDLIKSDLGSVIIFYHIKPRTEGPSHVSHEWFDDSKQFKIRQLYGGYQNYTFEGLDESIKFPSLNIAKTKLETKLAVTHRRSLVFSSEKFQESRRKVFETFIPITPEQIDANRKANYTKRVELLREINIEKSSQGILQEVKGERKALFDQLKQAQKITKKEI